MEFLQAFGAVAGLGVVGLAIKIGIGWGVLQRDVAATAITTSETHEKVAELLPRVQKIEHTLHGPDGENGMYSDVRELKRRISDRLERRRSDRPE